MAHIFFLFLAILVALFPVYLWGYGVSYLLDTPWNRRRFLMGMGVGGCSVGLVFLTSHVALDWSLMSIVTSIGGMSLFALGSLMMLAGGSVFARGILRRVILVHFLVIVTILVISLFGLSYMHGALSFLIPLLMAALMEESAKHLMSVGLMSQDFRFSRTDIILFTLFVVLGFVFVENILYLFVGQVGLGTWIFRSFFTLVAHMFAATLCAYMWWRAFSYEVFSWRYSFIFMLGLVGAIVIHLIFNAILEQGSIVGLILYTLGAYVAVTQGILRSESESIPQS